jgi:hypothetical protein
MQIRCCLVGRGCMAGAWCMGMGVRGVRVCVQCAYYTARYTGRVPSGRVATPLMRRIAKF